MANTRTAAWRAWLQEPDLARWYRNNRSATTAQENMRVLYRLCRLMGTTPHALVAQAKTDPKAFADRFTDFIHGEERKGLHGTHLKNYSKVLRGWLAINDTSIARWPKVKGANETRIAEVERVPTLEELGRILERATLRGRVCVALLGWSAVRPEVLGLRDGSDGLRLRDIPDLRVEAGRVAWTKMPARVVVRKELSKTRTRYMTFYPEQGCRFLAAYLERRAQDGEVLGPDSPVIGPGSARFAGCVGTPVVYREVKEAFEAAGFRGRPYVLRSFASTAFLQAEGAGLPARYAEWWLGHKGRGVEQVYNLRKGELPAEMVEDMRAKYLLAVPHLVPGVPAAAAAPANVEAMVQAAVDAALSRAMKQQAYRLAAQGASLPRSLDPEPLLTDGEEALAQALETTFLQNSPGQNVQKVMV